MNIEFTKSDRLKDAMATRGVKQADLVRELDISKGTASNWINNPDATPAGDNLARLCNYLQISQEWYLNGKGSMDEFGKQTGAKVGAPVVAWEDPADLDPAHYAMIKRLDVSASAGNGNVIYAAPTKEKPQSFRIDWLHGNGWKEDDLMSLTADGDSMEPTIADGATLLVNMADTTVKDGRVYVIRLGSTIQVKRLFVRPDGGLLVKSDNLNYSATEVPAEQLQYVRVLGRVVWQAGVL